jgi:hypothetical protein
MVYLRVERDRGIVGWLPASAENKGTIVWEIGCE